MTGTHTADGNHVPGKFRLLRPRRAPILKVQTSVKADGIIIQG
jgi:hypothetical protein